MKENKTFKRIAIGVIGFWLVLFVFLPNFLVFVVSFLTRDEANLVEMKFTISNYLNVMDQRYLGVFLNSIKMALQATALCLILAFPFSYILSSIKSNLRNILLIFIIVPFWTSALIRTYAIKVILTTNGLLNTILLKIGITFAPLETLYTYVNFLIESLRTLLPLSILLPLYAFKAVLKIGISSAPIDILYTHTAVLIGLVYTLLPFMILPLYAVMEKLDRRYIEAASDLGANKVQTFIRVIIPLTMPGIIAGSLLVFLPALGLFYIPDILGGAKVMLVGNLIKNQFMDFRNWPFGSAVSMTLTAIMALLLIINYRTAKKAGMKGGL